MNLVFQKKNLFIAAFLFIATLNAQEYQSPNFGKGLFNLVGKDSTWTMKIGARMQFLTTANWENNASNETNSLIRRSRLKFSGFAFSPKLKYKLELGLSNRDISGASEFTSNSPRYILDAVMKWNFAKNLTLWFGQTKLPGNRGRIVSSANMQFVDRSLLNSKFNIDRDMGMQLKHHFKLSEKFIIQETFSIAQGEGRNVTKGNIGGHQYTGRVEMLPFGKFKGKGNYSGSDLKRENTPKLAIATSYDFNNNAVKTRSNMGSYMRTDTGFFQTNISTFYADAMFKYKGFSFMGEYAKRDSKNPFAKNTDGSLTGDVVQVGNGLNLQIGVLNTKNWEFSGRYTNINLNKSITGKNKEEQYTFGVSKYIVGHSLKIQSDISYLNIVGSNNQVMYRLQFDIHF